MSKTAFEKKRDLCLKKLNNEVDLDWIEIKEELGLDCSPDHLRKISYGIKEYHNYIRKHYKKCVVKWVVTWGCYQTGRKEI